MVSLVNNLADTQINFVLVGVTALFALIILVVIYYALTNSRRSRHTSTLHNSVANTPGAQPSFTVKVDPADSPSETVSRDTPNKYHPAASPATSDPDMPGQYDGLPPALLPEFHDTDTSLRGDKKQVFHVKDSIFTYDDAEAVCKAYGADLADYKQMIAAYKNGANWCNPGWVKGQLALYPIQHSFWKKKQESDDPDTRGECGQPGINGGYYQNRHMQFGVNCYGDKRAPVGEEKLKRAYQSDFERELARKVAVFRRQLGNLQLAPFNQDKWHGC